MCGIVGYVGYKDALPVVLAGLERLEYRGYDSAGVAVVENRQLVITRAVGKLQNLKNLFLNRPSSPRATAAVGHTRWATHGRPSEANAHPHRAGNCTVVHNGIIENYIALRERLEKSGAVFQSETDTEAVAHLFNFYRQQGLGAFAAVKKGIGELVGSYALVILFADEPDRIYVARRSSPLVVGKADGEVIVASDITAILPVTREMCFLEDGDVAELSADSVVLEHEGVITKREFQTIHWDPVTAQKGGYKHFALKEIHEQPEVIAECLRGRISERGIALSELTMTATEAKAIQRIVLVGCGSAWHAGLTAKFWFEQITQIPCEVEYASEFRYRNPVLRADTLVFAVSQSGETADTLAAIDLAQKSSPVMSVCNVLGSSLARKVKQTVFTQAGPEISVCSTKGFVSQLVTLYLVALRLAELRGVLAPEALAKAVQELRQLPGAITTALAEEPAIEQLAKSYYQARDFLYLGRGNLFPIALEGALKLKEISYIHAEGYPSGEMKHGPLALVDEKMPIVCLLNDHPVLFEKSLSNIREAESRGGNIIIVTDSTQGEKLAFARGVLRVPHVSAALAPIVFCLPLQLLAYHVARLIGTDIDFPRNLAKSVTVE